MNNTRNSRKNTARTERNQQKLDAGILSTHFPNVLSIVIKMSYHQKGTLKALPRTVNFFPGSCALFRVHCLSKDCYDGGFDFTKVITDMIAKRKESSKGDLSCEGQGSSPGHSDVTYQVDIRYC